MATYRNVQMSFWTDSKVMDDFTPEDKLFFLYIMTNPRTSLCGCYECSKKQMSRDTGYSIETITNIIYRMENIHDVARYDEETKEILILNWDKYNWTQSSKVLDGAYKGAMKIKSIGFKAFVMKKLVNYGYEIAEEFEELIPYAYPMDKTVTVTDIYYIDVEQSNKDNKRENEEYIASFEEFWKHYPKKVDKKKAEKIFLKIIKSGTVTTEQLIEAVEKQKKSVQWQDVTYIPNATTWLNNDRWEDELKMAKSQPKLKNDLSDNMKHEYDLKELARRAKE